MLKQIAVGLSLVALGGLFGQSAALSWKLWRLNQSLAQNLAATHALVGVEHQMVLKNHALTSLLTVTQKLGTSLQQVNQSANQVDQLVGRLAGVNQVTNQDNGAIVLSSHAADSAAYTVDSSVSGLEGSTAALLSTLTSLARISQQEAQAMQTLLTNTTAIEEKTP